MQTICYRPQRFETDEGYGEIEYIAHFRKQLRSFWQEGDFGFVRLLWTRAMMGKAGEDFSKFVRIVNAAAENGNESSSDIEGYGATKEDEASTDRHRLQPPKKMKRPDQDHIK